MSPATFLVGEGGRGTVRVSGVGRGVTSVINCRVGVARGQGTLGVKPGSLCLGLVGLLSILGLLNLVGLGLLTDSLLSLIGLPGLLGLLYCFKKCFRLRKKQQQLGNRKLEDKKRSPRRAASELWSASNFC